MPDTIAGIDGVQQAAFFVLAALGGLLTNMIFSTIKSPFWGIRIELISFGFESFRSVNSFTALKYRQEIIFKKKELTVINDYKSTSFSSSLNLLKS